LTGCAAGLYFHVPFCSRVCPYCDFAVRTGDRARRARYVEHLLAEIELRADVALEFDTIYFGGGTPSSLLPEELARIFAAAKDRFRFSQRIWIFLEVNPEDVTRETAAAWRRIGVDTISLGVQSLDPEGLAFLGRRHTVEQGREAVATALSTGFPSVSIDLIYGLPGQTDAAWRSEMDRALALGVQHFSCYQLTVHDGTRFGLLEKRGKLVQLPLDRQAELFRLTHRHLNDAGMRGYEVSQFAAAPEHRSRHNLKYWDHTPYLGLGPAAHSFIGNHRFWNIRRTDSWQESIRGGRRPVEGDELLDAKALVLEALMTGLRTYDGVDTARLLSRFGIDLLAQNGDLLERLEADGLIERNGSRLVPTLQGLAVADGIAPLFQL
jgi:oxygen-independent coproporphyrinogen-3 oxidase